MEGCLREKKTKKARKDGLKTYILTVNIGSPTIVDGKKKYSQKLFTFLAKNKTEAEEERIKILAKIGTEQIDTSKITLETFLEQWMTEYVKAKPLADETIRWYSMVIRNHIIPTIGNVKLTKITPLHIQRLLNSNDGNDTTLRAIYATLKTALNRAVKWGLLTKNPLAQVDPPKVKRRKYRTLNEEETKLFLNAAEESRNYGFYLTALTTGLRIDEIAGLRWEDLNFEKGTISVKQQLLKGGTNVKFGSVKTDSSDRAVPMIEPLANELKKIRKRQAKEKILAGPLWEEYGIVFTISTGRPIDTHNISRREFKKLLNKVELPDIRFHDLRHSVATILMELGTSIEIISEILGHSSITITRKTYTHPDVKIQKPALEKLGKAFSIMG